MRRQERSAKEREEEEKGERERRKASQLSLCPNQPLEKIIELIVWLGAASRIKPHLIPLIFQRRPRSHPQHSACGSHTFHLT